MLFSADQRSRKSTGKKSVTLSDEQRTKLIEAVIRCIDDEFETWYQSDLSSMFRDTRYLFFELKKHASIALKNNSGEDSDSKSSKERLLLVSKSIEQILFNKMTYVKLNDLDEVSRFLSLQEA